MKTNMEITSQTQTAHTRGLSVKTGVKAGPGHGDVTLKRGVINHNETQAQERTRSFNVKTGVKAGPELRFPPFLRNP